MSDKPASLFTRLLDNVFPRMPDFFGMLNEQCDMAEKSTNLLTQYMEKGDHTLSDQIRTLEHEADKLKRRNIDTLHRAFSTPIDREDLFRAITSIDNVINGAKDTVREMDILKEPPEANMSAIAEIIHEGVTHLCEGYRLIKSQPNQAEDDAILARKTLSKIEKIHLNCLQGMFGNVDELAKRMAEHQQNAETDALLYVIRLFKRQDIYHFQLKHADNVTYSAHILSDILVKMN